MPLEVEQGRTETTVKLEPEEADQRQLQVERLQAPEAKLLLEKSVRLAVQRSERTVVSEMDLTHCELGRRAPVGELESGMVG
jgi:hypothetical protein